MFEFIKTLLFFVAVSFCIKCFEWDLKEFLSKYFKLDR